MITLQDIRNFNARSNPQLDKVLADPNGPQPEELFAALPADYSIRPVGLYRGKIVSIIGVDLLPAPLSNTVIAALQTGVNPWFGKVFYNGNNGTDYRGANVWPLSNEFGFFRMQLNSPSSGQGQPNGEPPIIFNYDIPDNPALLRPVTGECKPVTEDFLFCRMLYRQPGSPPGSPALTILYFSLTREI